MSNLTISVDEELVKRARVRAIQQGTSLSAKVREFLQQYANGSDDLLKKQREEATAKLMDAIELASSRVQPVVRRAEPATGKPRTLREDLYNGEFRARDRPPDNATPRRRK